MSLSTLALKSIRSQPKAVIPLSSYKYAVGIRQDQNRELIDTWEDVSKRDPSILTDDLSIRMPIFNPDTLSKRNDVGDIVTDVDATDSWRINVVLSHLPSLLRTIDKTLSITSHFPQSDKMALTLSHLVSSNRFEAVQQRVHLAELEKTYLLFDANLPRSSADGHPMPKTWLWDVYDELAYRLDEKCNTDDIEVGSEETCIYASNGRITYGPNSLSVFVDVEGKSYTPDEFTLISTIVTDNYVKRVRLLLQQMYDEGVVCFPQDYAVPPMFSRVTERLWKPTNALYPSAVEQLYN
jgi:hypothetical protein